MSAITHPNKGLIQLAKAFGIDTTKCLGFTVSCLPDQIATVEVIYSAQEAEVMGAARVVKRFRLEEQE